MDRKMRDIRDMEGIELMATFIGAWVKYGMMMLFVIFSSAAHILGKFKRGKK